MTEQGKIPYKEEALQDAIRRMAQEPPPEIQIIEEPLETSDPRIANAIDVSNGPPRKGILTVVVVAYFQEVRDKAETAAADEFLAC